MEENDKLIDEIIKLEWEQFQLVKNEGGRATCQEDYGTFAIMRRSQFRVWEKMVLEGYKKDLLDAEAGGWNLIQEKYMRMMEYTAPEQYANFAGILPVRGKDRSSFQESIIEKQIRWAEEVAKSYPEVSAGGRKIHSADDTPWETSMETYLRGELGTYSDGTLALYADMVDRIEREGKNLVELTLEYTAKLYGYGSLREAEEDRKK